MATSDVKACRHLQWDTDLSYVGIGNEYVSPVFRVRGIEHYFKLCLMGYTYKASLECPDEASRSRFTPFEASYCVQIERGGTYDILYSFTRSSLNVGHISSIDYHTIQSKIGADIRYRNILRFLFIFDSADELEIPVKTGDKSVQTPSYFDSSFAIQSLSEDFSKLLDDNSSSTDVELVCRGRTFTAHRSLLSVRSDVFKAMLGSDMTEGKTGRVQIEDAEVDIFQEFLEYLYKGKLEELTLERAVQLYKLGDKYAVGPLKKQCVSFFTENLAQDNACSILSLAHHHSDQDLKEVAMAYIVEQQIPIQGDATDWSNFSIHHPQLAMELMTLLCKLLASAK